MSRLFRGWGAGDNEPSFEPEGRHLLPRQAFAEALARSLRLLQRIHVPITLFAVGLSARGLAEAESCIGAALCPFGVVGRLADGRIGLLYLGPHSPGEAGERALATHLLVKIAGRLGEQGWGALSGAVELSAAHAWSDAVDEPAELLHALAEHSTPHKMAGGDQGTAVAPGRDAHLRPADRLRYNRP